MGKYYTGVGSRKTPEDVLELMERIAIHLKNLGYILRSGGADGADTAFEKGAGDLKEIYIPWKNFNGNKSILYNPSQKAMSIAEKFHSAWDKLKPAVKKIMARNSHQVLGFDLQGPSKYVICWTQDGRKIGGTAQAIRIAESYRIPIFNLGKTENTEYIQECLNKKIDLDIE